jgi:hypothetical protein
MPKRQGRDEFGFNLQERKGGRVEIQDDFYVVIFNETALDGAAFDHFAIRREDNLPRHSYIELRSCLCELGLCDDPVVISIKFGNLLCVPDRQRQYRLKGVGVLADG